MKKLILTTSILLLAAACSKQSAQVQPEQNQPVQTAQETNGQNGELKLPTDLPPMPGVQGVLKISDDTAKGNLMLVQTDVTDAKTGKNITIYLQTKRDFTAYLNKKVEASIQGAPGQFILDNVKEITDETANWKTYTSSKYGFEISYPGDWKFDSNTSNGKDGFFITYSESTRIWIVPQGEFDYGPPWSEPTTSNGLLSGKKVRLTNWKLKDGETLVWYILNEKLTNWNDSNRIDVMFAQKDSDTVNKIIDTFKFTK